MSNKQILSWSIFSQLACIGYFGGNSVRLILLGQFWSIYFLINVVLVAIFICGMFYGFSVVKKIEQQEEKYKNRIINRLTVNADIEGLKLLRAEINYIKSDPNLLEVEKTLLLNSAEVSDLIDRLEQQINN